MIENHLVTFPRSGSFFLKHILETNSPILVKKGHDPVIRAPDKRVISTIRNPKEALVSYITMLCHYRKNFDIEDSIVFLSYSYSEYCKYFIDNSYAIVEYDSLSKDTEQTLRKLFNKLGIQDSKNLVVDFNQSDMLEKEHLSSSKSSDWYKIVLDKVSSADLSNAIMYYDLVTRSKNYIS